LEPLCDVVFRAVLSFVLFHFPSRISLLTNFPTRAVFGYSGKTTIVFQSKGSDGLSGFVNALADDECQYGYVRVIVGDAESRRKKFVLCSWCGPNVGILKKAGMSVHKASVKDVCRDFSIEVHGDDRAAFDEKDVTAQVVKAMGANYMGQSAFEG